MNSGLPVSEDSFVKFAMQTNDQLFTNFEQALFKEPGEKGRFSYPADHPLASEFEEQMTSLLRTYKGEGEYLCASAPEIPGAHDDACDSTALALLATGSGSIGDILLADNALKTGQKELLEFFQNSSKNRSGLTRLSQAAIRLRTQFEVPLWSNNMKQ